MWAIQPGTTLARKDVPAAGFHPSTIPNVVFGVDAYSLTSSPVSAWPNLTIEGSARDAVQATGNRQPLWSATAFNASYPGVTFDGVAVTGDFLRTVGFTLVQPFHVVMVCNLVATSANKVMIDGVTGQAAIYQGATPGNARLFAGLDGPAKAISTVPHVISALFNGASSRIALDNGAPTTGNPGAANPGGITLGADLGGSSATNCVIAACWVYSGALAANTETNLVRYLGARFGITVA